MSHEKVIIVAIAAGAGGYIGAFHGLVATAVLASLYALSFALIYDVLDELV